MKKYAIIVAGGKGLRMGGEIPKQFLPVAGRPVLMRTLEAFHAYDSHLELILVLPAAQRDYWDSLCHAYQFDLDYRMAEGGKTRFHSVANGLALIPDDVPDAVVAVHDGVRPFVDCELIARCFEEAGRAQAVIPVVEVVDTLRHLDGNGGSSRTVDRSKYRMVQTPQTFSLEVLRKAYAQPYIPSFTDDASVVESLGVSVKLVPGSRGNIKLTTPFDLKIAEAFLT